MKRMRDKSFGDVWVGVIAWGIAASVVGAVLYGFSYFVTWYVVTILTWGHFNEFKEIFYPLIDITVASTFLGLLFGVPIGIADGLVLAFFVGTGLAHPRHNLLHRRIMYATSAAITSVGTLIGLGKLGFNMGEVAPYYSLGVLIAAIGGWWVARRVLTDQPKKKKNDAPIAEPEG